MNDRQKEQKTRKTKEKILKAACSSFIKKGFEGTSISEIAAKAAVNPSLIYHYYQSKHALWKDVKNSLLAKEHKESALDLDVQNGLRSLLEQIVLHRLSFYERNPDILRMMAWQSLEPNRKQLTGGTRLSPQAWKAAFASLQQKGEIRKDVDLDMMIHYVVSLVSGVLTDDHEGRLKDPIYKQQYVNMIMSNLCRSFGK